MSQFPAFFGDMSFPGMDAVLETVQNQFWWNGPFTNIFVPGVVSGASRDTKNTSATTLRAGLLLGRIASSNKFIQWDPSANDGSQYIAGVLIAPLNAQAGGSNRDRACAVMTGGCVMYDRLIGAAQNTGLEGIGQTQTGANWANALSDADYEYMIMAQMSQRFVFDKTFGLAGVPVPMNCRHREIASAATVTLTAADAFAHIFFSGNTATTLNLPAALPGLAFMFTNALTGATSVTLTPAAGKIYGNGSVSATTLALTQGKTVEIVGFQTPNIDSHGLDYIITRLI